MSAVSDAYRSLAERCGVSEPGLAVRSSAVGEDGAAASFAGQYETFLNIAGAEDVMDAILRCWGSARSLCAVEYRRQRGLSPDEGRVAVLVQRLVAADVSGAVFGADPVTHGGGGVVINASWGLGESIVGGTVAPDTYGRRSLPSSRLWSPTPAAS